MTALLKTKSVVSLPLSYYLTDFTSLMYCVSVYISCMLQPVCIGNRQNVALSAVCRSADCLPAVSHAVRGNCTSLPRSISTVSCPLSSWKGLFILIHTASVKIWNHHATTGKSRPKRQATNISRPSSFQACGSPYVDTAR